MPKNLEKEIERIIIDETMGLNYTNLFRQPMVAISSAHDDRYFQLKEIVGEWLLNPTELLSDAMSVVSYFVPFTKSVILEPVNEKNGSPLWGEAYEVINNSFNLINNTISNYLVGLGFSVKTIPSTHTYDPKDMKSMWSHRSAAAIAGLGSFGINRMLITEKGSGGRFCSVVTSAKLKVTKNTLKVECLNKMNNSCGLCLNSCPVNALKHDNLYKHICQAELNKNERMLKKRTILSRVDICGKCISVCPLAYIE